MISIFNYTIPVHVFGLFLVGALAVFLSTLYFELHRRQLETNRVLDNIFWILLSGLVGGRVAFVVLNYSYYSEIPSEIWQIWYGGFYFEGAFVLALLYIFFWVKIEKIARGFAWLDALIIASLPAQAIAKIGVYYSEKATSVQLMDGQLALIPEYHVLEALIYVLTFFACFLLYRAYGSKIKDGLFFYVVLIMLAIVHGVLAVQYDQNELVRIGSFPILPVHILLFIILTGAMIGLIMHVRQLRSHN